MACVAEEHNFLKYKSSRRKRPVLSLKNTSPCAPLGCHSQGWSRQVPTSWEKLCLAISIPPALKSHRCAGVASTGTRGAASGPLRLHSIY